MRLCLSLVAFFVAVSLNAKDITIPFNSRNSSQWSKTQGVQFRFSDNSAILDGTNWDSKIWRSINLTPGKKYELFVSGSGACRVVVVTPDWSRVLGKLGVTGRNRKLVTNTTIFKVPLGIPKQLLILQVNDQKGHAEFKTIVFREHNVNSDAEAAAIVRKCGSTRYRGFTMPDKPQYLPAARDYGANLIRFHYVPKYTVDVNGAAHFNWKPVMKFLDEAQMVGLGVVIDLHWLSLKPPRNNRDGQNAAYWNNENNLRLMVQFWQGIAKRCRDRKQIIWYDLKNEPLNWDDMPDAPHQWPRWAQTLIDKIREIDKVHPIVVESGPGGMWTGLNAIANLHGDKLIYSIHHYAPYEYTHQGIRELVNTDLAHAFTKVNLPYPGKFTGIYWDKAQLELNLAPVIAFQKKYGVRIYVGEFSVARWAPGAAQYLRDIIGIFEKYGWDWTYHAFHESNIWSFEFEPVYGQILKAKQPTETAKTLKNFLARNHENKGQSCSEK